MMTTGMSRYKQLYFISLHYYTSTYLCQMSCFKPEVHPTLNIRMCAASQNHSNMIVFLYFTYIYIFIKHFKVPLLPCP